MVYFDNAATTKVDPDIAREIYNCMINIYGNPSSVYEAGLLAKDIIIASQNRIAKILQVNPQDIFFTSGATESNNWVLQSIAKKYKNGHIITSSTEHPSVLNVCKELEKNGQEVTFLKVNKQGIIDIKELEASIKKNTVLISIMSVNNEIGSVQSIKEIGQIAKKHNILYHIDNTQGIYIDFDIPENNINFLSMSGHKFGTPKGIGFLYAKDNNIGNLLYGGHQNNGLRPGTENVPYIHGLGIAFEKLYKEKEVNQTKIRMLNTIFRYELKKLEIKYNSDNLKSHIINIRVPNINNEELLLQLDNNDIYVSAGSACNYGTKNLSHVLQAIGLTEKEIKESIRISFCNENTIEEIVQFATILKEIIKGR